MPRKGSLSSPTSWSTSGAPSGGTWLPDGKYAVALAIMMFVLFFYMTVPEATFGGDRDLAVPDPNPFYRILKFGLLTLGIAVAIWRSSLALLILRRLNLFFITFVGMVALSITWSIAPSFTGTRFVALCTISLSCLAFVLVAWHPRRFQNVSRPILTLLLIASLIFGIIAPDLAKESGDTLSLKDSWHGLFAQKNAFGQAASIAIIFWVHGWLAREVKLWLAIVGVAIGATCLLLSRSSTGMFAAVFAITLLFITIRAPTQNPNHKRRYRSFVVVLFVLIILIYSLSALNLFPGLAFLFDPIISLTGKDATFSGRTLIWEMIREHIAQRPLLGSGYGGYWVGPNPSSESYIMLQKLYVYPTESHDGYLDIINDLGYVGLICLLGYLLLFLRQSLALLKIDQTQALLFLALLFHQLIINLTETTWLQTASFNFVIMALAMFSLARAAVDQELRARSLEAQQKARAMSARPFRPVRLRQP